MNRLQRRSDRNGITKHRVERIYPHLIVSGRHGHVLNDVPGHQRSDLVVSGCRSGGHVCCDVVLYIFGLYETRQLPITSRNAGIHAQITN